jgi:Putative Ig domain
MHHQLGVKGIVAGAVAAFAALTGLVTFAPVAHAGKHWNRPPFISGAPPQTVRTGQAYAFRPKAWDPEGRRLRFSIVNKPRWAAFSGKTGRLSGTPGPHAAGEYVDIRIKVSDGRTTRALQPFSIVVKQANRAPKISGTPQTTAREGQAYWFKPSASDADGDRLRFFIANRPSWATFDPTSGRLSGTPGTGTVGSYAGITIRVSDGRKVRSLRPFSIGVEQASMGSATLSWQAPTQRADGSALTNLAGYRIRYGTAPGEYLNEVQIANPGLTSYVVTNLPPGTYYFVATAYDTAGRESEFSGVVSKTIG